MLCMSVRGLSRATLPRALGGHLDPKATKPNIARIPWCSRRNAKVYSSIKLKKAEKDQAG
jgi:hypothetical protein